MEEKSGAETVLVTGGSGFLGSWVILRLLEAGYQVRATLRSLDKEAETRAAIAAHGGDVARLSFVAADLRADEGWDKAVAGCAYVQHVASPMGQSVENGQDLVTPARQGTLRVLRAASAGKVRRVVITSSMIAAQPRYVPGDRRSKAGEDLWSDPDDKTLGEYGKAKVLAERAAWAFIEADKSGLTMTTLLPGLIVGPALGDNASGSVGVVTGLMTGAVPAIPRIGFPVSDVRDLADIHVRAMTDPAAANQRFVVTGDFLWMSEIADLLRQRFPERADKIPTRKLPDLVLRVSALFTPVARATAPLLGKRYEGDVSKVQRLLNWSPRPSREAILDCAAAVGA